jgi:phosphatidylglycerol:prolipoprotein diacylglycerol transferase
MSGPIVWNVDPVLLHLGPISVRYYGICFGLAIVTGFAIWYRRVRRFGESKEFAERLLWLGVPAIIIGGRLGYCFFYAPKVYLADPLRIFAISQGGIASHGVALGLVVALWIFSRKYHVTWLRLGDYFAPAVALAVGWIRVGNFFNSEVYGHATTVPWAIVFARHDNVPRHPAQLYDLLIGPFTWLVLREVERRNVRPIGSGLLAGTFLAVYFGVRMFVEPFKDFYLEQLRDTSALQAVERFLGFPIHTGQLLSVVPLLAGLALIARALHRSKADSEQSAAVYTRERAERRAESQV